MSLACASGFYQVLKRTLNDCKLRILQHQAAMSEKKPAQIVTINYNTAAMWVYEELGKWLAQARKLDDICALGEEI